MSIVRKIEIQFQIAVIAHVVGYDVILDAVRIERFRLPVGV